MNPKKEETEVWIALNRAQRSIHRSMNSALKEAGLPHLRWYDVLWELERAKDGLRPFELEKGLLFEQSNLSRLLRRIIDEGMVEERAYEGDGRGKVLRITAEGRALRKRMWKIYGPLIHENLSRIAEDHDMKRLAAALGCLVE